MKVFAAFLPGNVPRTACGVWRYR